jgi:glycerol-3-phosphate acyltransferase PlsX
MIIAVDAMGGDHAPREIVRGAVQAFRENGFSLILVGQEPRIREEMAAADASGYDIRVVHASEVVERCDVPGVALKKKKDSSIRVGSTSWRKGRPTPSSAPGTQGR